MEGTFKGRNTKSGQPHYLDFTANSDVFDPPNESAASDFLFAQKLQHTRLGYYKCEIQFKHKKVERDNGIFFPLSNLIVDMCVI